MASLWKSSVLRSNTSAGKDTSTDIIGNTYYEVNNTWLYDLLNWKAVILCGEHFRQEVPDLRKILILQTSHIWTELSVGELAYGRKITFTPEMSEAIKKFQVR